MASAIVTPLVEAVPSLTMIDFRYRSGAALVMLGAACGFAVSVIARRMSLRAAPGFATTSTSQPPLRVPLYQTRERVTAAVALLVSLILLVQLTPEATLWFVSGPLQGRATFSNGRPLAGARIRLIGGGSQEIAGPVLTDSNGTFILDVRHGLARDTRLEVIGVPGCEAFTKALPDASELIERTKRNAGKDPVQDAALVVRLACSDTAS